MDEHTWHQRTQTPLVIASLAYLVAYSWRVIGDLQGPAWIIATTVVLVTWAMFIADYVVRLSLAPNRRVWFRQHLPALAFALVPVLRLVRLLRFLTHIPGMKRTAGGVLRTQILVYGVGASLILIYIASLAVLEAERHAEGATITTFPIAIWWSCVTVTTTGYGDYTPVTDAGRWVGVGLMFGGVALAGVITATLASWVLERAARDHDDEEPATRAQVRALMERVDELTRAADAASAAGAAPGSATAAPRRRGAGQGGSGEGGAAAGGSRGSAGQGGEVVGGSVLGGARGSAGQGGAVSPGGAGDFGGTGGTGGTGGLAASGGAKGTSDPHEPEATTGAWTVDAEEVDDLAGAEADAPEPEPEGLASGHETEHPHGPVGDGGDDRPGG
ncbi:MULTISPECIES: potassium channel family protein [Microbacterium]|uniref:potassium channel family protein n=1 Tax=Microbacterium TaxID=33882 RepID=UPI0013A54DC8|nr:potassium channel family protein [Microbacterium sp. KCTC 39802]